MALVGLVRVGEEVMEVEVAVVVCFVGVDVGWGGEDIVFIVFVVASVSDLMAVMVVRGGALGVKSEEVGGETNISG